jgi:hypothetical protein
MILRGNMVQFDCRKLQYIRHKCYDESHYEDTNLRHLLVLHFPDTDVSSILQPFGYEHKTYSKCDDAIVEALNRQEW